MCILQKIANAVHEKSIRELPYVGIELADRHKTSPSATYLSQFPTTCFLLAIPAEAHPQCRILFHFRLLGPSKNGRCGDLESNALIGIEFYEYRQKLKNLELLKNSSLW